MPRGKPTYVFPDTLKNVVREIIPGALVDRPDPTHVNVSFFFFELQAEYQYKYTVCC